MRADLLEVGTVDFSRPIALAGRRPSDFFGFLDFRSLSAAGYE